MKLGIVIYSDHPETVWNAFRLANFSLNKKDQVKIFFINYYNIFLSVKSFLNFSFKTIVCGKIS
jgi:peroxiredoxin family protein